MNVKKLVSNLDVVKNDVKDNKISGADALDKIADIVYTPETDAYSNDFENYLDDNDIGFRDDILDDSSEYSDDEIDTINDSSNDYFDVSDPTIDIDSDVVVTIINDLLDDVKATKQN